MTCIRDSVFFDYICQCALVRAHLHRVCIRIYMRTTNRAAKVQKKNPHTQIYAEKNAKFVVFASKKGGYGLWEAMQR